MRKMIILKLSLDFPCVHKLPVNMVKVIRGNFDLNKETKCISSSEQSG